MQSFNRVKDPVVDQDNAKLIGAVGGGYAGWKHKPLSSRGGILSKINYLPDTLIKKPFKVAGGAGLGALAAGVLARAMNKENKEDHELEMAQAQNPYGMMRYASYREDSKTDKVMGSGVRGGLLGALAAAVLGGHPVKGAGLGALANAAHTAYQEHQSDANTQTEDLARYPQTNNMDAMYDKYAMEKEARRVDYMKLFSEGTKKATNKGKQALKNVKNKIKDSKPQTPLQYEFSTYKGK